MSAVLVSQVAALLEITSAITSFATTAQNIAAAQAKNGGPLSDAQWEAALDEHTRVMIALATAINARRARETIAAGA